MTDAPERIYLDGDVEAGDGMFPRCFESPKYASEPQVEYIRADLATQLQKKKADRDGYDQFWAALEPATPLDDPRVKALVEALKEAERMLHEARIEELEAALPEQIEWVKRLADDLIAAEGREARLKAKLAKAVEALDEAVYLLAPDEKDMMRQAGVYRVVTTLAELKGQNDE